MSFSLAELAGRVKCVHPDASVRAVRVQVQPGYLCWGSVCLSDLSFSPAMQWIIVMIMSLRREAVGTQKADKWKRERSLCVLACGEFQNSFKGQSVAASSPFCSVMFDAGSAFGL